MPTEAIAEFFNPAVVLALLTLSLLLTLYLEHTRLERRRTARAERAARAESAAQGRDLSRLLFWLEFGGTFLLLTLLFFAGASGIRMLALGGIALFGSPWLGLVLGVLAFGALVGILMLGRDG